MIMESSDDSVSGAGKLFVREGGSRGGDDGGGGDKERELGGAGDEALGDEDRCVGGRDLSKRRWD